MKYLLLGDENEALYIENDNGIGSIRYDKTTNKWVDGGNALWAARVGFDESEDEDSIYRYGDIDSLLDIILITKSEAEAFIGHKINEKEVKKLLKC